ncbi:hypothetical protein H4S07_003841 [Coemansia furcata]|uniref:Uncharacterized protein n=1 Tax=Coemansia furcata TaxID=417177 RepID=A0ACC1LEY3_9FUNG|nr:hypothetical protein H4S07_003841 [Coemansia furcata]
MLGADGLGTSAPSPIQAADHSMVLGACGFSDSSHQSFQHSTAAAVNFGIGNSFEHMGFPTSAPITGDISALHYLVNSAPPSGVFPASTLFSGSPPDSVRVLRRSVQPEPQHRRGSLSLSRSHPYIPSPQMHGRTAQRRGSSGIAFPDCPQPPPPKLNANQHGAQATKARTIVIPAINQDGTVKKCTNCMTAETPSWRRHPDTQALLCNACGLYLRLHRKPRPVTIDEAGNVQVIRKNAAVQREPMNLPARNMHAFSDARNFGSSSVSSLSSIGSISIASSNINDVNASLDQLRHDQPHSASLLLNSFNFTGCPYALRTNTSLASLQGIGEPFSPMELYSPTPHAQHLGMHTPIDGTSLAFQNMLHISEIVEPKNEIAAKDEDP